LSINLQNHSRMKKTILLFIALFSVGIAQAQNTCASSPPINPDQVYTVSAINGNVPPSFCEGTAGSTDAGEWYKYTASENGSITVTTDLPGTGGADTRIQIYSGNCGNLNCEGGDDAGGTGTTSLATINVEAGTTYYIVFDNRWYSGGFDFMLSEGAVILEGLSFTNSNIVSVGSTECVVDMNGDFLDDIVSVTATNIRVNAQQPGGGFIATDYITTNADHTPSWSICAGDINGDGFNDLLYAGGGGVTFMMSNDTQTAYTEDSFDEYVFCQRSNMVDINNDGRLDAFVCHDVDPNVFFINHGANDLRFYQGGLGETPDGGNYGSVWIDYDNDQDVDLFIAKCRGGDSPANINQLHRNNGNGTYQEVGIESNLYDNVQTWSSAWGDYDNDGWMDALIGASSFTNGYHKLMHNNGDGTFTDITAGSGWAEGELFSGTGIEYAPADFNNDGYIDVRTSSGVIMLNNGDMEFRPEAVPSSTGAVGDLNNDGFLDIMAGGTIRMNDGNENNYVKINTIGTVSNKSGIGARVRIVSALGAQIRDVRSGDGFAYMSSLTAHFGLGFDDEIERLEIYWPSGIIDVIENPEINTTHNVVEGTHVFTDVEEVEGITSITTYPNPATNVLNITADTDLKNANVTIFDINGKRVYDAVLKNNSINVEALTQGVYIVVIRGTEKTLQSKFTKL